MTRHFLIILFWTIILTINFVLKAEAAPGDIDQTFQTRIEAKGDVRSVVQPDGKIIVYGDFDKFNGVSRSKMARLNADGSIDASFNPPLFEYGFGNQVAVINRAAGQTDGKIVIVGNFTSVGGTPRKRIARLNTDGSLDTTFSPGTGISGTVPEESIFVQGLAVQTDGKILVGGFFQTYNGVDKLDLMRLNPDGSLDASFNAGNGVTPGGIIFSITLDANNLIYVTGQFRNINSTGRFGYARLLPNGTVDTSYSNCICGADNTVVAGISFLPDGKAIVYGSFVRLLTSSTTTFEQTRIARLNVNGTVDESFAAGNIFNIPTAVAQPDGKVIVADNDKIVRLNQNATRDFDYYRSGYINGAVNSVTLLTDGRLLFAGGFTRNAIEGEENPILLYRNGVARLDANGYPDASFNPGTGAIKNQALISPVIVKTIKNAPGGKIYIAGDFTLVNGKGRRNIARLNADGSLDETFNPRRDFNDSIDTFAVQPDGKIVVFGEFTQYGEVQISGQARLNADGTLDNSFQGVFGGFAYASESQPDGKIIVGGAFTVLGNGGFCCVGRINPGGIYDSSFNLGSGTNNIVHASAVQPDGKILIAGAFTSYNGAARGRIARLNADGSLDQTFQTANAANNTISSIILLPDGKVVIGGDFTTFNNTVARNRIARLNANGSLDETFDPGTGANGLVSSLAAQFDGKVIAVGSFNGFNGAVRRNVVRLNQDGSVDASFDSPIGSDSVPSIVAVQPGTNKILVGGAFTSYNAQQKLRIVRLESGLAAVNRTPFDFDGDGRADVSVFRPNEGNWYLQQSSAGFGVVNWGISTDALAPADYDGDGKTDFAVFRPVTSPQDTTDFYILNSSNFIISGYAWGIVGDIPIPADFDADGKAEIAVRRPSTNEVYIRNTNGTVTIDNFGLAGDVPLIGDFDGDGKNDIAVYRNGAQSTFFYRGSLNNPSGNITFVPFGVNGDKPVVADYDGDGKTDVAVYRNGVWYIRKSLDGTTQIINWGISTDKPVSADYDGDGKADLAVYRSGVWYVLQSANNQPQYVNFGLSNDTPIPAVYFR